MLVLHTADASVSIKKLTKESPDELHIPLAGRILEPEAFPGEDPMIAAMCIITGSMLYLMCVSAMCAAPRLLNYI